MHLPIEIQLPTTRSGHIRDWIKINRKMWTIMRSIATEPGQDLRFTDLSNIGKHSRTCLNQLKSVLVQPVKAWRWRINSKTSLWRLTCINNLRNHILIVEERLIDKFAIGKHLLRQFLLQDKSFRWNNEVCVKGKFKEIWHQFTFQVLSQIKFNHYL